MHPRFVLDQYQYGATAVKPATLRSTGTAEFAPLFLPSERDAEGNAIWKLQYLEQLASPFDVPHFRDKNDSEERADYDEMKKGKNCSNH